ncbi:MAG TPA: glycine oxidase ThiO [Gaiellaceae bacterium]|nr:glycine oxidase ThiO [Gaiellaceae bacterium]
MVPGERVDLAVAGGGVIGLACAWRARSDGLRVRLLERGAPGGGATHAAAGILAPDTESEPGAAAFAALGRRSLELWPEFAAELERETGHDVGFARSGTLVVALDRDEADVVAREAEQWERLGLSATRLGGSECRRLEPGLSTACVGGVHVPHEAQVDPRRVAAALVAALGDDVRSGVEVVEATAGAVTLADGSRIEAERVLLATGAWSGAPVRPVKGQVVRLRGEPPCERMIRSEHVYVVPRPSGEVVVGATAEERGFDTTVTAGAVHELLREAYRALPEIAELEFVEAIASLRPGTPDNGPLLGERADGVLVATGHYRNGILLAPATAEAIVSLLAGGALPEAAEPFAAGRFA